MAPTPSEPVIFREWLPRTSNLRGTDERQHALADFRSAKVLVVAFICNHCPYVKAVQSRIGALSESYCDRGVQLIGINSNDPVRYPEDSFEAMKKQDCAFPYLWDETQEVARAYGAVCTPDFFVFERAMTPNPARGRLDDNWKDERAVKTRDLAQAIDQMLPDARLPMRIPSMGCSIKWKT